MTVRLTTAIRSGKPPSAEPLPDSSSVAVVEAAALTSGSIMIRCARANRSTGASIRSGRKSSSSARACGITAAAADAAVVSGTVSTVELVVGRCLERSILVASLPSGP
jgi:hypothetical protein